jgi:TolA-binding protein
MSSLVNAESLNSLSSMRQKMMQQEERIDGLTTIVEGLSASLYELQSKNHTLSQSTPSNNDVLLQKLATMIDGINADYVTKSDLKKALAKFKGSTTKVPSAPTQTIEKSKKPSEIYSEGVRHFVKKRYDEAKKRFTFTDEKHYKPAASNYYLGEIAYYTKQYENAIFYFKKSAGLYEKASYMDTLLLHTAISLDKTGKKNQARSFYENIIENYKGKKTASIAKTRLKKL